MTVYRDTVNLTKMTNARLRAIKTALLADKSVKAQYDHMKKFAQNFGWRKEVFEAAGAIDAWTHCHTVTTATEASPESQVWSNLEGGHIFHQVPSFKAWLGQSGL